MFFLVFSYNFEWFLSCKTQVIIGEESFDGISNLSFKISLTRPALVFNSDSILALYSGWTSPLSRYLCVRMCFCSFFVHVLQLCHLMFCRKHNVPARPADVLAIKRSFQFEVWVSTWKWQGRFCSPKIMLHWR